MPFRPDGPSFAGDPSWWASGGWHIVPLILFVILIAVIVWAVLRLTTKDQGSAFVAGRADGALEEVRVRYARGEMTRPEFVQRFRDLGGTGVPDQPLASSSAPQEPEAEPMPPTEPTPPAT